MDNLLKQSKVLDGRFRGDDWAQIIKTVRLRWPDAVAFDEQGRTVLIDGPGTPSRPSARIIFKRQGAGAPAQFDLAWSDNKVSFAFDDSSRLLVDWD